VFFIKLGKSKNIMGALYKGLVVSGVLTAALFYPLTMRLMEGGGTPPLKLYFSALVGLAVLGLMVVITDYYTSKKYAPVRGIAAASETGHGTNIIAGLALS